MTGSFAVAVSVSVAVSASAPVSVSAGFSRIGRSSRMTVLWTTIYLLLLVEICLLLVCFHPIFVVKTINLQMFIICVASFGIKTF